jgi:hypothetical protein
MFVTNYLMLVILGLPFTPMPQHTILLVGGADSETATLSTETVDDLCRIKFCFRGQTIEVLDFDYFEAFIQVRNRLEQERLIPVCYGASLNVFPSGMCRSMGEGLKAYRLKPGQMVKGEDLVGIFDTGPDVIPATVSGQREYYEQWLNKS